MTIRLRNAASEWAHADCGVAVLDIDISYAKDENNLARTAAYEWSNYIVQKLKKWLTGGRIIVETKEDWHEGIIRIKGICGRTLAEIATAPGYTRVQTVINNMYIPIAPATRVTRNVETQIRQHERSEHYMTGNLPSIAEFDRQLLRMHMTNDWCNIHMNLQSGPWEVIMRIPII